MKIRFGIWIVLLIIELIWFSSKLVGPHSIGDVIYVATVVLTTLVVGATGLFLFNENNK
ncbi:hypothetical protein [Thermohalobacter berrensis]|uniref:hypothetical protein n=1 Tax=Thermohalobacter berrensis TaxID=99594 RepID=UPI0015FF260A|nr:hypothetical protein [Thermohalobacter berrensis]